MSKKKKTILLILVIFLISLLAVCANHLYSLNCLTDHLKQNYFNGLTKLYDPDTKLYGFCAIIYILPVIAAIVSFLLLRFKLKNTYSLLLSVLVFVFCVIVVALSVALYSYNYSSYCSAVVSASSASWDAEMQKQDIQDNSPANEIIVETF
jgi:hypothetical protein